jgi:hypothetical protein
MMIPSNASREALLYQRCDEVLHYVWDPIGISGIPVARDEYASYLPAIFDLVRTQADEAQIASYLLDVEAQWMGLSPDAERANEIAGILTNWRDWIWENIATEGGD